MSNETSPLEPALAKAWGAVYAALDDRLHYHRGLWREDRDLDHAVEIADTVVAMNSSALGTSKATRIAAMLRADLVHAEDRYLNETGADLAGSPWEADSWRAMADRALQAADAADRYAAACALVGMLETPINGPGAPWNGSVAGDVAAGLRERADRWREVAAHDNAAASAMDAARRAMPASGWNGVPRWDGTVGDGTVGE